MGESYLKELIRTDGTKNLCSYCSGESPTLSLDKMGDIVERAFEDHYVRTAHEPCDLDFVTGNAQGWEREGEPAKWAILNAANVSEEAAEDIHSMLTDRHADSELFKMGDECPFGEDSHYAEKDAGNGDFLMLWTNFVQGLKEQSRFFSPSAKSILDQIFAGISDLRTTQNEPVVVTAGPGTETLDLYRARVFADEDDKLEEALKAPWKLLGTPSADAAKAGRMNALGIAVFYGARDAETALKEVRPPVGSKVGLAAFRIIRPLRLLDLPALRSVAADGSIFDPATLLKMQRSNFLEELSQFMSRAVMPLKEVSEYLPTQAVADYLANEAGLDGIIYPSVQNEQKPTNVVLFHYAARVEEVILPNGTTVAAHLAREDSDGMWSDYRVWKLPPDTPQGDTSGTVSHSMKGLLHTLDEAADFRDPSLRIIFKTIEVRHINAVNFKVLSHKVT